MIPLIIRELRATARQPFTHSLRLLGVVSMMAACGVAILGPYFSKGGGGRVFGYLHFTLFCATWVLVPLLTADSLSRERREGTLPLLFLTPLRPRGIVLAKTLAHGLRALSLWLAVLPTMCIPFLLGGVGWREAVLSATVNFSSMVLALSAGLLASSFCKTWRSSILAAVLLAFVFAMLFIVLDGLAVIGALYRYIPTAGRGSIWRSLEVFLVTVSVLATDFDGTWSQALSFFRTGGGRAWIDANFGMVIVSLMGAWIVVCVAAWRVKRIWRDEPESARAERIGRVLRRPVFGAGLLRRWLNWRLARNPVGWPEQRRAGGRLVAWFWFAAVVLVYGAYGFGQGLYTKEFERIQQRLGGLLLLSIVMASAGSFRRERENGVIELLLVSPMREWEVIRGRLRALWSQFLPAIAIFVAGSLFQAVMFGSEDTAGFLLYFALGYLTLPVIGLYFSLARKHFIAAVLWTILFGAAFPVILMGFGELVATGWDLFGTPDYREHPAKGFLFTFVLQAALALVFALILKDHLARRKFALELN